jgi:hypothetical protein
MFDHDFITFPLVGSCSNYKRVKCRGNFLTGQLLELTRLINLIQMGVGILSKWGLLRVNFLRALNPKKIQVRAHLD